MATPVFCCGAECGAAPSNNNNHVSSAAGNPLSVSTTVFRSGLRSWRANPTASTQQGSWAYPSTQTRLVGRVYVRFDTLPSADCWLITTTSIGSAPGIFFKQSDSKLYAAVGATLGASGIAVTTGIFYRLDFDFNIQTAGSDTCDLKVDGTAAAQATATGLSSGETAVFWGTLSTCTADIFFDDIIFSFTSADYPLGDGYVLSYIPNADGTHNVAGANDFERSLTGTDITNATTDAYQLIDDRPLPTTAVDFINGIAPPNSTDYVEWQYEDSVENVAPRAVEAIFVTHDAGGAGTCSYTVTLRDNGGGTTANIFSGTQNVGGTITYRRAHFATIPGAGAWTLTAFNALRSRFLVADASPDPYIDAAMLEAEYPGIVTITSAIKKVTAALNADQSASGFQETIASAIKKVTASLNAEQRQTVTVNSTLVKTAASIAIYLRPEAEIDSVVAKVVASLVASQRQQVTVGSTLAKVTANVNVQQEQRVTVSSSLTKVAASVNVVEQPNANILTTLAKVTSTINTSQINNITVVTSAMKPVQANINLVMQPAATITTTLAHVTASLNAQQRFLMSIATILQKLTVNINVSEINLSVNTTLAKVIASLNAEQRYLETVTTTLAKVSSNINVNEFLAPEFHIATTLAKVQAALNASQRQEMSIATTFAHVTAALNLVMVPDARIVTTIAEVVASLNAEQRYLLTIDTDLAKVTANLNLEQQYLITIATVLAKVASDIHVMGAGPNNALVNTTLAKVMASLSVEQRYLISIGTTLAKVSSSISVSEISLLINTTLAKLQASLSMSQRQEFHVTTTLAHVQAVLSLNEISLRISTQLAKVTASLSAEERYLLSIHTTLTHVTNNINVYMRPELHLAITLAKVQAALHTELQGIAPELTITTSLRPLRASLSASQRYLLSIASALVKIAAALSTEERENLHVATALKHLTADINLETHPILNINTTLAKVIASILVSEISATVNTTLRPVEADIHLFSLLTQFYISTTLNKVTSYIPDILVIQTVVAILSGCVTLEELINRLTWIDNVIASGFVDSIDELVPSGFVAQITRALSSDFVAEQEELVPSGFVAEKPVIIPSGYVRQANSGRMWDI